MARLLFWLIWLICLIILCLAQSRRIILTPQFAFVGCFIPQAIFALFFVEKWNISFCNQTMYVLVCGVTLFLVESIVCDFIYFKLHPSKLMVTINGQDSSDGKIYIDKGILVGMFVFQVVTVILMFFFLARNVPGSSIIEKIAKMAWLVKFADSDDIIYLPFIVNQFKAFCCASSYIFVYLLICEVVQKYKHNRVLLYLNLIMCMVNMLLSGNRGPFVELIVATVVQIYFIWGRLKNWKVKVKFRSIISILAVFFAVLLLLYETLLVFGRTTDLNLVDYLGEYLSAPLKNLDTFIREGNFGCKFDNSVTFYGLRKFIGRHFDIQSFLRVNDLPFRTVNGYNLGNVHTAFYSYLHDGGVLALIILLTVMVVILHMVFVRAALGKKYQNVNLWVVIYSYMFQTIALSFFSDRFYFCVFSVGMLKNLFSWWLLVFIFTKFNGGKIKIKVRHRL